MICLILITYNYIWLSNDTCQVLGSFVLDFLVDKTNYCKR